MGYNKEWGNRFISDLQRDFDLSRGAAIGFAGVLAMESEGFGDFQEDSPTVKGSRGGGGMAMWTGPRRKEFESWAKKNGYTNLDSYDANYQYLKKELKDGRHDGGVLKKLRGVDDPKTAGRIVTSAYLRPGKVNQKVRDDWVSIAKSNYAPTPGRNLPDVGTEVDVMDPSTWGVPIPATMSAGTKAERDGVLPRLLQMLDRDLHKPRTSEAPGLFAGATRSKGADVILAEDSIRNVPLSQRIIAGGGLTTQAGMDFTPDVRTLMGTDKPVAGLRLPRAPLAKPEPLKSNISAETNLRNARQEQSILRGSAASAGASRTSGSAPIPMSREAGQSARAPVPLSRAVGTAARVRGNTQIGFEPIAEMLTPSHGVTYPERAAVNGNMTMGADLALLFRTGDAAMPKPKVVATPVARPESSQLKIDPNVVAPRPRPRLMGEVARALAKETEAEKTLKKMAGLEATPGAPTSAGSNQAVMTQLSTQRPATTTRSSGGDSSGGGGSRVPSGYRDVGGGWMESESGSRYRIPGG